MDGTETCRLEDEIAVALDGREGLRWAGIFLDIAEDAGYRPQDVRQAKRDLSKAQRAIDASLARLHADRGALPRGGGGAR
jgi:hypothetical protein